MWCAAVFNKLACKKYVECKYLPIINKGKRHGMNTIFINPAEKIATATFYVNKTLVISASMSITLEKFKIQDGFICYW